MSGLIFFARVRASGRVPPSPRGRAFSPEDPGYAPESDLAVFGAGSSLDGCSR